MVTVLLIPIKDYAKFNGLTVDRVRQRCLSGRFLTAKKIGRNWFVDDIEILSDGRKKNAVTQVSRKNLAGTDAIPAGYIPLNEYAVKHGRGYKGFQQKAIRGGFKTALKVGNQWFIDYSEPYKRVVRLK